MERALSGEQPETGERLRNRISHDKHLSNGRVLRGRTMFDCVFSAPKSLSVVGLWDERLDTAHRQGVLYTSKIMESWSTTREKRGGKSEVVPTGNLLYSEWNHRESRSLDPNRHTHLAIVNMTFDPNDGRWKALHAAEYFRRAKELTEAYRYVTAHEVEKLGYSVRDRGEGIRGWEIAGVPDSVLEKFSQRTAELERAKEGFRSYHDREPSEREILTLVRNHRPEKEIISSWEQWRQEQENRLTPKERDMVLKVRDDAVEKYAISMENRRDYWETPLGREKNSDHIRDLTEMIEKREERIDEKLMEDAKKFAYSFHDHADSEPGQRKKASQKQAIR